MVVTIFTSRLKNVIGTFFMVKYLSISYPAVSDAVPPRVEKKLLFSNYYPGAFIIKTWVGVIVCLPTVRVLQTMSSLSQSSTVRRIRVRFTQDPFCMGLHQCSCGESFCLGFGSHPSLWSSSFLRLFRFGRDRYKNRTDVCLDMCEWSHVAVT